jgi:molybdopterin molybdotransferase
VIPLEEARRAILAECQPLHPRAVPLADALGCATSVAVTSDEAVPPFANTAVDGFAVLAADVAAVPVTLAVVATLPAGADPAGLHADPGQAIRIMTGAPMPDGADAVVMVEDTTVDDEKVTISRAAKPGDHVRPPAEDVAPGDVVFGPGTELTARHLGVLASIGFQRVPVHPRPRVGVLSTGDELVADGRPLRPGQIRDTNRPMLLALVEQAGCTAVDLGLVADDEAAVTEVIERGLAECDALVTSGGVSMGDFDYVKVVLERIGRMHWWQIAIKPAKPLAFGVVGGGVDGGKPVFGLPGNPVSSLVSFELFARPALRRMMGHRQLDRPRVKAIADEPFRRRPDGKLHLVRVSATFEGDGRVHVRSSGGQASNLLRAMALANALALVPDGEGFEAGADVEALLLS